MKVKFELVIPSLQCSRKITKFFKKYPKSSSARISDIEYGESVINYAIRCQGKVHRFRIKRLPSAIRPEMTKFEVQFKKFMFDYNSFSIDIFTIISMMTRKSQSC